MRWRAMIFATAAVLAWPTTPARAATAPTFHNNTLTCPDGTQFHESQPNGLALDPATMLAVCRMNAALGPEQPTPTPSVAPSRQMTSQEVEDRLRRSLGAAPGGALTIKPLPGQGMSGQGTSGLGTSGLGSVQRALTIPSPPPRTFTMTREEFNQAAAMCADELETHTGSARVPPADILPICGCRMRAMQHRLTHAEFNAYIEWELWRTSWRHKLWTVELPAGVSKRLAIGNRSCADEHAL